MRTTFAFAFASLAAAACGGDDIEADLRLADRTDAELARLINAATCSDMFMFTSQLNRFGDNILADRCPSITVSGDNVATITGGCMTFDGVRVHGSATVTNPFGWNRIENYDASRETVYTANQLVIVDGDVTRTFDGVVRRSDDLTTWDADLTVTSSGITLRSDLSYVCGGNSFWPSCELSGHGIELAGIGGVHVSGTVEPDAFDRPISNFTLQGTDRLTVHSDGSCVAWSIDGTDRRMLCPADM